VSYRALRHRIAEAEPAEMIHDFEIQACHLVTRRVRRHRRETVHLVQMIDRPGVERSAECVRRGYGNEPIVGSGQLLEHEMHPLQRPGDLVRKGVPRNAKACGPLRGGMRLMKLACATAREIADPLMVDADGVE
jgi:hypothetical protein